LPGFDLLPRIRNWHDLVFYRPAECTRYQHIDSLFGDGKLIGHNDPDYQEKVVKFNELLANCVM
jgi:hypothetical protein